MKHLARLKPNLALKFLQGWRKMLGEARTRILIWYLLLLSLSTVASVLTVRQILFNRLEERVEQSLFQEVEEFRQLRNGRNPATGQPFGDDIETIFDVFLSRNIPEDNEYLLATVRGMGYRLMMPESVTIASG